MRLKCGVINESVKYQYGNTFEDAWIRDHKLKEEWLYSKKNIQLQSAKNDFSAFQILMKCDEDFVLAINNNTVFSPYGPIPIVRVEVVLETGKGLDFKINAEGLIEDDDRVLKADLLLNDECVLVKKDVGQPIWIEAKIPKDFSASFVKGHINLYKHILFEDEQKIDTLEFSIDIADFTLPDTKYFSFYLNLWQHSSNISRKHEVTLWSDEHFAVLENYIESLAALGQKVVTIVVSEIPWSGQRCFSINTYRSNLFEYNIVKVERDEKGEFNLDFSAMDRYVDLCMKYGIDKEIELIGLLNIWNFPEDDFGKVAEDYPDSIRIRYYDKADKQFKFMKNASDLKVYIKKLEEHITQKGWIELTRVMADEPHDADKFEASHEAIKEAAPGFKYKVAISHTEFIKRFKGKITDFVPSIGCVFGEWDEYSQMKEDGAGRYLWYTACGGKPDSSIRAHLLETRFIGWLTSYLGLEGFLRWNFTVWPEEPRKMICYNYPSWPAGETNFVYPANNGKPLLTLRYKSLMRGIHDFELLEMLKRQQPQPQNTIDDIFGIVIKDKQITKSRLAEEGAKAAEIFSLEYDDYEKARRLIFKALI